MLHYLGDMLEFLTVDRHRPIEERIDWFMSYVMPFYPENTVNVLYIPSPNRRFQYIDDETKDKLEDAMSGLTGWLYDVAHYKLNRINLNRTVEVYIRKRNGEIQTRMVYTPADFFREIQENWKKRMRELATRWSEDIEPILPPKVKTKMNSWNTLNFIRNRKVIFSIDFREEIKCGDNIITNFYEFVNCVGDGLNVDTTLLLPHIEDNSYTILEKQMKNKNSEAYKAFVNRELFNIKGAYYGI